MGPRPSRAEDSGSGSGSGSAWAILSRQYEIGEEVEIMSGNHGSAAAAAAAGKALAEEAIHLAAGGEATI